MSNEPEAQGQTPESTIEQPAAETTASAADVALLQAELAKAKDDLLRALAEVQNTRRRGDEAVAKERVYAIDRFARDLLPVADALGRALASITPQARDAADDATRNLFTGVEMMEKVLIEAFARHGMRPVGAKGEVFDPNRHQAVAQIPHDSPPNTVAEVMQPGYVLGDRTLRAAMVVVSAGPAKTAPGEAPPASGGVDIKV